PPHSNMSCFTPINVGGIPEAGPSSAYETPSTAAPNPAHHYRNRPDSAPGTRKKTAAFEEAKARREEEDGEDDDDTTIDEEDMEKEEEEEDDDEGYKGKGKEREKFDWEIREEEKARRDNEDATIDEEVTEEEDVVPNEEEAALGLMKAIQAQCSIAAVLNSSSEPAPPNAYLPDDEPATSQPDNGLAHQSDDSKSGLDSSSQPAPPTANAPDAEPATSQTENVVVQQKNDEESGLDARSQSAPPTGNAPDAESANPQPETAVVQQNDDRESGLDARSQSAPPTANSPDVESANPPPEKAVVQQCEEGESLSSQDYLIICCQEAYQRLMASWAKNEPSVDKGRALTAVDDLPMIFYPSDPATHEVLVGWLKQGIFVTGHTDHTEERNHSTFNAQRPTTTKGSKLVSLEKVRERGIRTYVIGPWMRPEGGIEWPPRHSGKRLKGDGGEGDSKKKRKSAAKTGKRKACDRDDEDEDEEE
ncbi:MAG: hypothetical protein Q9181_008049, partial [Wetmoreana brouardii]